MQPDRIQVVPCGTDHARASRAREGWSGSGRRLLFVGRLSPQKNIPLLLEAVSAYRQDYDAAFELEIIGEGELRGKIESMITSLGLSDVVRMRGAVTGPQLQAAYQQADLLLLTSVNESFGLVLVEAMTKALPIVSVNIPAVRNVMTNGVNGLMTAASPAALAEAIHTLLSDRELYATVSRNNLERARTYSWRAVAEQLVPIYQSIGRTGPVRVGR
jgi:glycosyltransferase involved in cell wall biosynthesis